MRLRELWRITTFRLSLIYGVVFAVATVVLLALVYIQSAVYLTQRVDRILEAQARAEISAPPAGERARIEGALALRGSSSLFGLFGPDHAWIAGNQRHWPRGLEPGARPIEIPPSADFPAHVRLIARKLPSGDLLIVGRDIDQLSEIRRIIASALIWSGLLIIAAGLVCGVAFSIEPLRRLKALQDAGHDIAAGNLNRRMPSSGQNDELDLFAGTVNYMLGEVERLMSEVRASTETIAHDLRTPLTRARAQLHRLEKTAHAPAEDIAAVTAEIDEVLARFLAIMRISELEARGRSAGFAEVDLAQTLAQAFDLYLPLAEAAGVELTLEEAPPMTARADPKLIFEALSNLIDNAIKFSGEGGHVRLALEAHAEGPGIVVADDGPGVPAGERSAVLQRFYRGERDRLVPGSGLGLSIVAAIVRLHRFRLELEDADPGLRVVLTCVASPQRV